MSGRDVAGVLGMCGGGRGCLVGMAGVLGMCGGGRGCLVGMWQGCWGCVVVVEGV